MKQNKKIIHAVVKYFYPVAAGIETNMLETYSILAKNGWDVTIHTSKDTLTQKNVLKNRETIRGLSVLRYPYEILGFFPKIDWDKTDIVCLHNFNVVPHIFVMLHAMVRKILGKKAILVLTPHGGFTPDWLIFPWYVAVMKKFYHYTLGAVLINNSVDIVRAVSEWERNEIISHGVRRNKVITITNGIENEAYMDVDKKASVLIKKQVKKYGKYLIQIGRIYGIKNYETTIKALAKLPKHVNFVIVGLVQDYDYLESLKNLIKTLGVEKRVFFHGVVRGIDKYYLIKHAAMMVHMARWESFCNAVHEGMSQGLVCIVANNTALPLLIKDGVNGYCIETNDSKNLVNMIDWVLSVRNRKKVSMIKQLNKSHGLENSWNLVALKLDEQFKSLIRSKLNLIFDYVS